MVNINTWVKYWWEEHFQCTEISIVSVKCVVNMEELSVYNSHSFPNEYQYSNFHAKQGCTGVNHPHYYITEYLLPHFNPLQHTHTIPSNYHLTMVVCTQCQVWNMHTFWDSLHTAAQVAVHINGLFETQLLHPLYKGKKLCTPTQNVPLLLREKKLCTPTQNVPLYKGKKLCTPTQNVPLIIREHSVWGYTVFSLNNKGTFCVEVHSFFPLYKGCSSCVSNNPGTVFSLIIKGKNCVWGTQFFPLI